MKTREGAPVFFYLTGCDGSGKTTQARLLVEHLRRQGYRLRHVWMRFPFFFSTPLLLYSRLRKWSWYEKHDGRRYGYWDFSRSWLMKTIFPWILLLDACLAAAWKIYLPLLLGWRIVCERFVLDMVVDLSVGFQEHAFLSSLPARLFHGLLPQASRLIVLDLDTERIVARRPDLAHDRSLDEKRTAYKEIARMLNIPILATLSSVENVLEQVIALVEA